VAEEGFVVESRTPEKILVKSDRSSNEGSSPMKYCTLFDPDLFARRAFRSLKSFSSKRLL